MSVIGLKYVGEFAYIAVSPRIRGKEVGVVSIKSLVAMFGCVCSVLASSYVVAGNGGSISLVGSFSEATCVLGPRVGNQVVELGRVQSGDLVGGGESPPVPFVLVFRGCHGIPPSGVSVVLRGVADASGDRRMLALDGLARGAGVVLAYEGKDLLFDEPVVIVEDENSSKIVKLTARLKGNGEDVVAGDFSSVAQLVVTYH